MKTCIKFFSLIGAAAIISAGTAVTSHAEWLQEDGTWVYLDSSGNRVTDTWKKSGEQSFYLDSSGELAMDTWIDDTYYVDENGVRQESQWVYAEEGEEDAPNSEGGWFYLDSNGKLVTEGWKTIDGKKYYFDTDGTMKYGWFRDDNYTYYLGGENDGAAKTGWLCLEFDEDEIPEDGEVSEVFEDGSTGGKWFYFQDSGKAVEASEEDGYIYKTISGYRYYFDENGAMATGWTAVETKESTDVTGISTLKYLGGENDGRMATGWLYITEEADDSDSDFSFTTATSSNAEADSDTGAWYNFNTSGVPRYLHSDASNISEATVRLNGKSYLFDEYGQMQLGLVGFELEDGTVYCAYFGSDESDGAMKTERQTNVYDADGDSFTYYFMTSGENKGGGYTGVKNDYLYYNGKLVEAEDGSDVQVFQVNEQFYLVNESGKVQTSNKTYKSDGEYRYEYSNGTIYFIDSDKERLGEVSSGEQILGVSLEKVYLLN